MEDGTVQEGDFTYAIENGEATVTAFDGCAGLIIVAPRGSRALDYANSHGIQAVAVESLRHSVRNAKQHISETPCIAYSMRCRGSVLSARSIKYVPPIPQNHICEIDPLLKIPDAYPKVLIARIYEPAYHCGRVRIVDAADWLTPSIPQN